MSKKEEAPEDISLVRELPADAHRVEVSGLWGFGKLKFSSTARQLGPALGLAFVLFGAGGSAYGVYLLGLRTALSPGVQFTCAMLTAVIVFIVGIWLVITQPTGRSHKTRKRK